MGTASTTSRSACALGLLGLLSGFECASEAPPPPASHPDRAPPLPDPVVAVDAAAAAKPAAPTPVAIRREPLPRDYLAFESACEGTAGVTIAAVGDLLMHHELQKQAYAAPDGFGNLWAGVADLLAATDITYANLEVPLAAGLTRKGHEVDDPGKHYDNRVYSGYPQFNAHASLASDLATAGFDVVSTANNHSLDRGALGIDRTLQALSGAGLAYTGTRAQASQAPFSVVTRAGGLAIAWIACTLHTNFGKDTLGQVLHCFAKDDPVSEAIAKLHNDAAIDAVIVTPHWGKEYAHEASPRQIDYAQRWIDAGAIAIIGAHPHVLQPWEKRVAADGHEALVVYSLGNFASHQRNLDRRSSAIVVFGLHRDNAGAVKIAGAGYVPISVRMEGNKHKFFVEAIDRAGGPADAEALVSETFGAPNRLAADEPMDVRRHCDPTWSP